MNSIIKPLIGIVLLAPAVTASSATPNNNQQRRINLNALRLVEEYERYSSLRNDEYEENFRYIFNNDTIALYNDLIGLSEAGPISIDDYVEKVKGANGVKFSIKNISGGPITDGGDVWLTNVTFDKTVQYSTPCGAIIESTDYYDGTDYSMTALIAVDKTTGESHIRSLTGNIDSRRQHLTPGFALVQYTNPRDKELTNNGKTLSFNKYEQAFVTPPFNWQYADDDVTMKVNETGTETCREFSFEYRPTRWRVRPQVNISLGDAYKVDAPEGVNSSVSGMDFGVDFGYVFPSRGKIKVGAFIGLGMSMGKIDLEIDRMDYSYAARANADMDADTYTRYYELSDLTQSIKMSHFTVPVYADIEFRASRRVAVFAQVGVKAYFNAGSKIDKYSGKIYSYGVYSQYQDLMIDESWLNNFGHSEFTVDDLRGEERLKGFSADVLLGVGTRVRLVGPLSLDLGLMYQAPVIDRIDNQYDNLAVPSGRISESQAPVTYTVSGGQVASHALSDYCKIKSNPLKLKVGLTYKF